jgi:hypothetical protein
MTDASEIGCDMALRNQSPVPNDRRIRDRLRYGFEESESRAE